MTAALTLVLLLLVLGYLARKLARFPENAADVLNRFVIDLCLPAALLRMLPKLQFEWSLGVLVLVPWLLALLAYGCARLAGRLLGLDRASETVLFLCTALGNTSFLGYPLCAALLGEASLPLAGVYDQLGSFLMLSTLAPLAITRARGGARPTLWASVRGVLQFPPFLALIVGLMPIARPAFLDGVLATIAAALVPVAIFAVGLKLRITPPRALGAFVLGLVIKLGVMPLIAWGLARLLDAPPAVLEAAVLQSAMPAMITAGALAMAAGLAPELAAALIGWGVVAALFTVPAWAEWLR